MYVGQSHLVHFDPQYSLVPLLEYRLKTYLMLHWYGTSLCVLKSNKCDLEKLLHSSLVVTSPRRSVYACLWLYMYSGWCYGLVGVPSCETLQLCIFRAPVVTSLCTGDSVSWQCLVKSWQSSVQAQQIQCLYCLWMGYNSKTVWAYSWPRSTSHWTGCKQSLLAAWGSTMGCQICLTLRMHYHVLC